MRTRLVLALSIALAATARAEQVLLAVDYTTGDLYRIDPTTGQASSPVPTSMPNLVGIDTGPDGTVYAVSSIFSPVQNSLFTVDVATGALTLVGPTGFGDIEEGDVAWDPDTDTLVVAAHLVGLGGLPEFLRVDPSTGAATSIGYLNNGTSTLLLYHAGLAYDPTVAPARLYGWYASSASPHATEIDDGTALLLASVPLSAGIGFAGGMDFDETTGQFYVIDGIGAGATNMLRILDPTTGVLTDVGPTGVAADFSGLAFWTPPPVTYCAGKLNSEGCVPFVSTVGTPSASATTPFQIRADDVIDGNFGFLMYGFKKANLDFHGGKLCIKAPVQRLLPPKFAKADGTPPCRGVLRRNFNQHVQGGSDPQLTAGQVVVAQWYQRDVNDPAGFGDSLTDAVRFTICP